LGPAIGPAIPSRVDAQRLNTEAGRQTTNIVLVPQQLTLAMARVYRNSDVGLFPNRCEGGANLVLMEYMACGKPVVTVDTTGQGGAARHAASWQPRSKCHDGASRRASCRGSLQACRARSRKTVWAAP